LEEHTYERYLDYLLMAAQGGQESTLDHCFRRRFGAIGVMQVMPETGRQTGRF
jgi:membrane-bound lytic murein transglycosylase MltF